MNRKEPRQIEAVNNFQVGTMFEKAVQVFFSKKGLKLLPGVSLPIGINGKKKPHKFDLGDPVKKVIVECKSYTWTKTGKVPSAKMATWNEAMHIFCAVPREYRKIFCVMHNHSAKHGKTLAEYYLDKYAHLIPNGVEIWEYDQRSRTGTKLR